MRSHHCIELPQAILHYSKYGKGDKVILFFHGFGQNSKDFRELEEIFKEQYTIYNFDLFYHGQSFWHQRDEPLTKEYWRELMEALFKEHSIDKFSVLGYSMGGKFTLACLELFPSNIQEVILIAPDGIKLSFWYRLATSNKFFRKIFRKLVAGPYLYKMIASSLRSLRLVDHGVMRFTNSQMHTRAQRRRVYYSWVVFRLLRFKQSELLKIFSEYKIPVTFFIGEYDRLISHSTIKSFLMKLENYNLHLLDSGHSRLIDAVAKFYKEKKIIP